MKTKDDGFEKAKDVDLGDTMEITGEELKEIKRAADQERIHDLLSESAMMQADTPLWVDHELNVAISESELSEEELTEIRQRVDKEIEEMEREVDQYIELANNRRIMDENTEKSKDYDAYLVDAGRLVTEDRKATIGYLQRELSVGYYRASRILEQLAEVGVIGEKSDTNQREILMTAEEFETFIADGKTTE